ncbi:hypothetical protein MY4038_004413 [Beauveria bassiana]
MAPTPPSADVASSASPHSEDPLSKLELIEQELQSIKQVVHPHGTNGAESNWTPPTPQVLIPNASENHSRTFAQAVPQAPTPLSEPSAAAPPSAQLPEQRPKSGPTQARMLGEHMVSGEDIDWYFNKFLNRFHTAMSVHASSHGQAPSSEVARWEQEFETLRPAIIQSNTDLTYVLSLSALLEIQTFYFSANPEAPPHTQRINYLRAFNTARSLISTVLEQESRSKFLTHATNQIFRSLIDAACIVTSMLYSTSAPPDMSPNDANQLAQHAAAVLHRCSVEESDLPHRIGVIIETFWNIRHLIPRIEIGPRAWSDRLGVGMSFWCLELYKRGLRAAQKNSETAAAANRADELIHAHCRKRQNRAQHSTEAPAVENGVPTSTTLQSAPMSVSHPNNMLQPMAMGPDIFQEIDWSMFTDDFGWIGDEGVLLGLP